MTAADPTETRRLFQHDRVAAGYASARPYLHPEILGVVRDVVRPAARFRRALDVGCGTGLSSVALLLLAQEVIGIDAALDMLRHARRSDGVRYVTSAAEAPPFRPGAFDLVAACGSMDWVERPRFMPRAAELLAGGGWLVSLDFGDTGRSPGVPGLARWYDGEFQQKYPRPPASDPIITPDEAARHGFGDPVHRAFASVASFTARQYAAFLMTESNVIAAIEYGGDAEGPVRAWLESELYPLFGDAPRPVAFSGYIQALREVLMRILSCLLLLPLASSAASATETAIRPDRTIHLFDGKSLAPFYTWLVDDHREDPLRVFSVVDQVDGAPAIRISGERWGGLVTREPYRDYRLVVEFRWGLVTWGERRNSSRDSGILIHGQGPDGNTGADGNGAWMRSVEAQVIEGGVGDFILVAGFDAEGRKLVPRMSARAGKDRDGEAVFDPQGGTREFEGGRINWFGRDVDWQDRLGFRGKQDVESPYGDWTRLEVIADGDRITIVVNGKVVNEGTRSSLTEGRILVQSEGAEIYFRRIDLEPLK